MQLPDAIHRYLTTTADAHAVDLVLANRQPPTDLTSAELDSYFDAQVSAFVIQRDLARTLREAWRLCWGSALDEHAGNRQPLPLAELADWDLATNLGDIWSDHALYDGHRLTERIDLITGVWLDSKHWLRLYAFGYDTVQDRYLPSTDTQLHTWLFDREEDAWLTMRDSSRIDQSAGAIDLSGPADAAAEFVRILQQNS